MGVFFFFFFFCFLFFFPLCQHSLDMQHYLKIIIIIKTKTKKHFPDCLFGMSPKRIEIMGDLGLEQKTI